jgi:hypothetical protein
MVQWIFISEFNYAPGAYRINRSVYLDAVTSRSTLASITPAEGVARSLLDAPSPHRKRRTDHNQHRIKERSCEALGATYFSRERWEILAGLG